MTSRSLVPCGVTATSPAARVGVVAGAAPGAGAGVARPGPGVVAGEGVAMLPGPSGGATLGVLRGVMVGAPPAPGAAPGAGTPEAGTAAKVLVRAARVRRIWAARSAGEGVDGTAWVSGGVCARAPKQVNSRRNAAVFTVYFEVGAKVAGADCAVLRGGTAVDLVGVGAGVSRLGTGVGMDLGVPAEAGAGTAVAAGGGRFW